MAETPHDPQPERPESEQPAPGQPGDTPPPPPPPPPGDADAGPVPANARTFGMLCHLAALAGFIGIPLGNILGPLIVWLIKREEDPFIDDQGKEALNFQITLTIAAIVAGLLICVVIGFVLLPVVLLLGLIFLIIASVEANKGTRYRYPSWAIIRLIK